LGAGTRETGHACHAPGQCKECREITKKLYEVGKSLRDREATQHVDEILDQLRDLKQSASELEDENRTLRESYVSRVMTSNSVIRSGVKRP
jgi:hypothetical protein